MKTGGKDKEDRSKKKILSMAWYHRFNLRVRPEILLGRVQDDSGHQLNTPELIF